jgi:hypothetical protein
MSQVAHIPRSKLCLDLQVSQAHHNFAMNAKPPPLKPLNKLRQFVQIRVVLKVYPCLIGHDFKLLRHALDEAR